VENQNLVAGTDRIAYSVKVYDDRNILIAEKKGSVFLPPQAAVYIFEGAIDTGERVPARAFFEFTGDPVWEEMSAEKERTLIITNHVLRNESLAPRLDAVLKNTSVQTLENIEVVAVLFDGDGNAVAASKTVVDSLDKDSSKALVFTWGEPFAVGIAKIEVTPRLLESAPR
jgi:hypothetical protein